MPERLSLLDATLAGYRPVQRTVEAVDSGQIAWLDEGLLAFEPAEPCDAAPAVVLSAGIHGNETAPVELLDELVGRLMAGRDHWRVPALVILGNPEAMRRGTRFVDFNLNRLFTGAWRARPTEEYETARARLLEAHLDTFLDQHRCAVHYDLHTAIRSSAIEKFALYPFVAGRNLNDSETAWLGAAEIEALLVQHAPATTFSSHSSRKWGIESFTLELGKVRPFGQNDLSRLDALRSVLLHRLKGERNPPASAGAPRIFRVRHEVLRTSEQFRLNVAPETPNFTLFRAGETVWEDQDTCWRAPEPLRIVFPNPDVPVGQRAGLLVQSDNAGSEK